RLGIILADTFKEIEDISNLRGITNVQLRRVIDRIEVDHDGNVEVFLKLFRELGLDETVPICNDCT
ncbi:MAG: recombinase family protein, partial [Clostridia bacterium]|nr:recombinase family protein [Clostridia bacterium]